MKKLTKRVDRLRALFPAAEIEGFLVTNAENRYYLTGFTGSAGVLLIDGGTTVLMVDGRYVEQARGECPHCEVLEAKRIWPEGIASLVRDRGLRFLGAEAAHVSCESWGKLEAALSGVKLFPVSGLVEKLRLIKEPEEIIRIRKAVRLVDDMFAAYLPALQPGVRERDWALDLEFAFRRGGAERAAFDFIVASGRRSALPHGAASEKELKPGELVVIDCGAVVERYCSDFTRTVVLKEAAPWQQRLYEAVLMAQEAAIAAVRPGVAAGDVDRAARSVLTDYGYAEAFSHSTGHGLGLAVHEEPRLAEGVETVLEPGMVVTVEPGVYLPGKGGVRIEDVVAITRDGPEVLTAAAKAGLAVVG
ncbi:MAG: Xaa-Pro peptidase family protein [Bacillota bacterium]